MEHHVDFETSHFLSGSLELIMHLYQAYYTLIHGKSSLRMSQIQLQHVLQYEEETRVEFNLLFSQGGIHMPAPGWNLHIYSLVDWILQEGSELNPMTRIIQTVLHRKDKPNVRNERSYKREDTLDSHRQVVLYLATILSLLLGVNDEVLSPPTKQRVNRAIHYLATQTRRKTTSVESDIKLIQEGCAHGKTTYMTEPIVSDWSDSTTSDRVSVFLLMGLAYLWNKGEPQLDRAVSYSQLVVDPFLADLAKSLSQQKEETDTFTPFLFGAESKWNARLVEAQLPTTEKKNSASSKEALEEQVPLVVSDEPDRLVTPMPDKSVRIAHPPHEHLVMGLTKSSGEAEVPLPAVVIGVTVNDEMAGSFMVMDAVNEQLALHSKKPLVFVLEMNEQLNFTFAYGTRPECESRGFSLKKCNVMNDLEVVGLEMASSLQLFNGYFEHCVTNKCTDGAGFKWEDYFFWLPGPRPGIQFLPGNQRMNWAISTLGSIVGTRRQRIDIVRSFYTGIVKRLCALTSQPVLLMVILPCHPAGTAHKQQATTIPEFYQERKSQIEIETQGKIKARTRHLKSVKDDSSLPFDYFAAAVDLIVGVSTDSTKQTLYGLLKTWVNEHGPKECYVQGIMQDWIYSFGGAMVPKFRNAKDVKCKDGKVLEEQEQLSQHVKSVPSIFDDMGYLFTEKGTRILDDWISLALSSVDPLRNKQAPNLWILKKELVIYAKTVADQVVETIDALTGWKLSGSPSDLLICSPAKSSSSSLVETQIQSPKSKPAPLSSSSSEAVLEEKVIKIVISSDEDEVENGPKPLLKVKKRKVRGDGYRGGKKKRIKKQKVGKKQLESTSAVCRQ
jgi:hypothetical protein